MTANKPARRMAVGILGLAAVGTVLGFGGKESGVNESGAAAITQVLTWTADRLGQFTWDGAVAAAAVHAEAGFDDWRLPTVAEAESAMRDGTFGSTEVFNGVITQYTTKSQGQWNTAVRATTDANGVPIPSTVTTKKVLKASWLLCKFVRP